MVYLKNFITITTELVTDEELSNLFPEAISLYGILLKRLNLSYYQTSNKSSRQYYDLYGNMYVVMRYKEAKERLYIKRGKQDKALTDFQMLN